jgi:hypothetical protein
MRAQAAESQQWLPPKAVRVQVSLGLDAFALDSPYQHRDFHAHASLTRTKMRE